MRYAFTIIYNGLHHLTHNGMAEFMATHFDHWVVVDGLSANKGSTSWCNDLGRKLPKSSDDGTIEFMEEMALKYDNITFHVSKEGYPSKDNQVNTAIQLLSLKATNGYLWQVDVDEQWCEMDLQIAEQALERCEVGLAGGFQFNHYCGHDAHGRTLIATGPWGSGIHTRLWRWSSQLFTSHEPPVLAGQTGVRLMPVKYDHFSYSFEKDVAFKARYYKGYGNLLKNWKSIQNKVINTPIPVTSLLGHGTRAFTKNSYIHAI